MKVLVTARLPENTLKELKALHDVTVNPADHPMPRPELLKQVGDKDGLLCTISDRVDEELLDSASGLKIIANYGVGFDHINVMAATARGILVSNTPGVLTDATAEVAFALILAIARRVVEGDRITRSGKFPKWSPLGFLGTEVSGKTLGIIGLGQIGKATAKRALGFDMKVLYNKRNRLSEAEEKELGVTYADMNTLLAESDFVSLHVNLSAETHHLISKSQLEMMKPGAFLINVSRGPVVDEQALVTALKSGNIAGAGLDVYENEPAVNPGLCELDNVVLLPHLGSATLETRTRMAELAVENLLQGLAGLTPKNCLNPNVHQRSRLGDSASAPK
jgi:glyoxylate reductase